MKLSIERMSGRHFFSYVWSGQRSLACEVRFPVTVSQPVGPHGVAGGCPGSDRSVEVRPLMIRLRMRGILPCQHGFSTTVRVPFVS